MVSSLSMLGPAEISSGIFSHLLSLYPDVLLLLYKSKIKDAKKLSAALEDDKWRYEVLPMAIKERRKEGAKLKKGLTKEELQRLVQWKITHGTYRPFLPALIRKNDPDTVESVTDDAFASQASDLHKENKSEDIPRKLSDALKIVSKLQGVGPATAPLICSIYDPDNVPFFEDELYEWLMPGGGKLKYDLKEYKALFLETRSLRRRIKNATAQDIEKVGLVIGHLRLMSDDQQAALKAALERLGPQDKREDITVPKEVSREELAIIKTDSKSNEKPKSKNRVNSKGAREANGNKRSNPPADDNIDSQPGRQSKRMKASR